jgi:hypothetical protein
MEIFAGLNQQHPQTWAGDPGGSVTSMLASATMISAWTSSIKGDIAGSYNS